MAPTMFPWNFRVTFKILQNTEIRTLGSKGKIINIWETFNIAHILFYFSQVLYKRPLQ